MTEKLEEYLVRYEELNHQLSDPQIIADRDPVAEAGARACKS